MILTNPLIFKRPIVLGVFCATVLLFSLTLQANPRVSVASSTTAFRMTLVVPPNSINPLTLTTGSSGGIFIGMQYYGTPIAAPDGTLDNAIAVTDWVSHNQNYTQWTFNVRPGLKWSNGQNVTSADILATFSPNFGFNATYDYLGMGPEVNSESALNSSAVVYVLNVSDAHWPDKFNWDLYSPIYPASFIQQQGAGSSNFGTDVEVGPFYVSNYQPGQTQLVMLRNPYFNTTGLPEPQISEVDVNFVDSLSLTTSILQSGTNDLAPVEPSNAASVVKNPNVHILDEKGLYVTSLQYNDSIYPYNMTQFRQALAYGMNQTQYVNQALNGYGVAGYSAEGVVSPSATFWYNPNIQKYQYSQTTALALLSQIGIVKQSDNLLHYKNGTVVTLSLWVDSDNTEDTIGASVVQSNLQSLGFKVNPTVTSASNIVGDYYSNLNNIRSAMILYTSNAPVWGNPYLDSLPAWDVYWLPTTADPYWEYPPSADVAYQSNFTAFRATADLTLEQKYIYNIEAINSQNLPTLVLAYPDALWGYNTQRWTNWPSGYIEFGAQIMNNTAFANLMPASSTTTTNSTTASNSTQSSSSTTTSTPPVNYTLIGGIVVAIIVIATTAAYLVRRR